MASKAFHLPDRSFPLTVNHYVNLSPVLKFQGKKNLNPMTSHHETPDSGSISLDADGVPRVSDENEDGDQCEDYCSDAYQESIVSIGAAIAKWRVPTIHPCSHCQQRWVT